MSSIIKSAATIGIDSGGVEIEVDVNRQGVHRFTIVGLADTAIKESKDRVASAIKNSGFKPVHQCGIITVSLAPADLPKSGPIYDLPIALGILLAAEQLSFDYKKKLFVGELALDGRVRSVSGILPLTIFAKENGYDEIYVPVENAEEASVVEGIKVVAVDNLYNLAGHLSGVSSLKIVQSNIDSGIFDSAQTEVDMKHIKGQEFAKRALEIAAAGGHNVLFNGPPGSGKTMLAKTLVSILPRLTLNESLEITKLYSISGKLAGSRGLMTVRPFRNPHHSSSSVSLVGGGSIPKPGEISLAHRGVLFLDEFAEFPKIVLENLRQPLEDGSINISRAKGTLNFPAQFILIAAMNPCPCGNASDPERMCSCSPAQIIRYQQKISGPILDRIDLHVEVPRISFEKLETGAEGESSFSIRERVENARIEQSKRFSQKNIITNSEMGSKDIGKLCALDEDSKGLMKQAISSLKLSPRSYYRIIKVARTIADLENEENIKAQHIAEALQYRFRAE